MRGTVPVDYRESRPVFQNGCIPVYNRPMFGIDWQGIFAPTVPLLEIFIRGSAAYLLLFLLMRLTLRRVGGAFGLADILMVALIAAAVQNAMARDHHSVTDGMVLVATIVFWSYALDWFGHRFPSFQKFYHSPALPLVKDGRMLRRNMRQELLTEDELIGQLHREGIANLGDVAEAYMEGDGSITAIVRKLDVGTE